MTLHLRCDSSHPNHPTLAVISAWCGEKADVNSLRGDGRQVDCEACKRAWENVARPVTNIEMAKVLKLIGEAIGALPGSTFVQERLLGELTKLRAEFERPTRKWPFDPPSPDERSVP